MIDNIMIIIIILINTVPRACFSRATRGMTRCPRCCSISGLSLQMVLTLEREENDNRNRVFRVKRRSERNELFPNICLT